MPKKKLDPLPSAAFHILLSLAGDDLHGYAIMRAVARQTDNRMRLGPGTLYSSTAALLDGGYIEEVDAPDEEDATNVRRRLYRPTREGRNLARAEADRLASLLRFAREQKIFRGDNV